MAEEFPDAGPDQIPTGDSDKQRPPATTEGSKTRRERVVDFLAQLDQVAENAEVDTGTTSRKNSVPLTAQEERELGIPPAGPANIPIRRATRYAPNAQTRFKFNVLRAERDAPWIGDIPE